MICYSVTYQAFPFFSFPLKILSKFLQDELRYGENKTRGVFLCGVAKNIFLCIRKGKGNHVES